MGDIRDSASATWRDYEVDGVPSSGPHKPEKAAIIETMGVVEDRVDAVEDLAQVVSNGNGSGFLTYTTLSAMNAAQPKAAGTTCQCLEDKNQYYSNGSSWVLQGPSAPLRLSALEAAQVPGVGTALDTLKLTFQNLRLGTGVEANKGLNTSGNAVTSTGRYVTDFIPVNGTMKLTRFGSGVTSGSFVPYAFYDKDKAFISSAWATGTNSVDVLDLSAAPSGTKYIRLTFTNTTVEAYLYEPKMVELLRDFAFSLFGTPIDVAGALSNQYFDKADGTIGNSSSWRMTDLLPLTAGAYVCTGAGLVSETISTQALMAFYAAPTSKAISNIVLPTSYTISSASWSAGVLTLTMASNPGWGVGYHITIAGSDTAVLNDAFDTVAGTSGTEVKLAMASDPGPITLGSAYAYRNTVTITATGHGYVTGQVVDLAGIGGTVQLNGLSVTVTRLDADTFTIGDARRNAGIDPAGFGAYTSGGTATGYPFLGYYNPKVPFETVKVADHYPTAAFVRVAMRSTEVGPVYTLKSNDDYDHAIDMVASAAVVDWFSESLISGGRINSSGGITQPTHPNWRNTDFIPVKEGQVMYVTLTDATSSGPMIAGYSDTKAYVKPVLSMVTREDCVARRVVVPAGISYIRAMFGVTTPPNRLYMARLAQAAQETVSEGLSVSYLAPNAAYGRKGENLYLFARGVVGDRSVPVTWAPTPEQFDDFRGAEKLRVRRDTAGEVNMKVRAIVGKSRIDIATFPARFVDTATAVSPGTPMNVVCIGDSTTSQLSSGDAESIDGNGTWVNEMARQLTGTGDPALTASPSGDGTEWGPIVSGDIRTALSLGNIYFRGTRGTGTIKHEGRGGWHPISYLTRTNVVGGDGKTNAFWDAGSAGWGPGNAYKFSMKYYIENNGWDVGSIASGVVSGGGNLLVIIALGWNPWGNGTDPGIAAGQMGLIVGKILEEYPSAKIWVPSLWAPPSSVFKANTGTVERWYSPAEIFDGAVREFGEAWRAMAADAPGACDFVHVAAHMDPDYCFSKSTMAPNRTATDSTLVISGAGDCVHMRRRGYRMLADVLADKFLWDFCRP